MRKLIMWNVISLDGFFEGDQPWDLEFHSQIWGEELERFSMEQLEEADFLLFGRKTYEGMAAHWTKAEGVIADYMNQIPKLVGSRTLTSVDWHNSSLIPENLTEEIKALKQQKGKDFYVFGSAELCETLIQDDLIDEYRIGITPVILGKGRPLFRNLSTVKKLNLISTQPLKTGGIIARYSR